MKGKSALICGIVQLVINCILVPLFFIKIFCNIAVLPGVNGDGEAIIGRFYHYQSIFDRFARAGIAHVVWISIAFIGLSTIICGLSMVIRDNKMLKISSYIVFGISIVYFLMLLFMSIYLAPKY